VIFFRRIVKAYVLRQSAKESIKVVERGLKRRLI
jgi:hypothetical protein